MISFPAVVSSSESEGFVERDRESSAALGMWRKIHQLLGHDDLISNWRCLNKEIRVNRLVFSLVISSREKNPSGVFFSPELFLV